MKSSSSESGSSPGTTEVLKRRGVLIGAGDGYRMLVGDRRTSTLHPMWSTDGRSWAPAGADLQGYIQTIGLLAGTPAAILVGDASGASLLMATGGGGWTRSDLLSASGGSNGANQPGSLIDATIGPLGLAAATYTEDASGHATIIDSPNGLDFSSHTVGELAGSGDWTVTGVSMNADAVIVRLRPAPDSGSASGSPAAPGPQRLLVGTPR